MMTAAGLGVDLDTTLSCVASHITASPLILEIRPSTRTASEMAMLPTAVIDLVVSQGGAEHFLINIIDHIVGTTPDPALIFRGETLLTKILAEFCKYTSHLLIETLFQSDVVKIITRKYKESYFEDFAESILTKLIAEADHLPPAFMTVCCLINIRIAPMWRRLAISNLIFLRCISPLLLDLSLRHIEAKHPRNLSYVIKLIQNLANRAALPSSHSQYSKFMDRNLDRMGKFLDRFNQIPPSDSIRRVPIPLASVTWWIEWIEATGTHTSHQGSDWKPVIEFAARLKAIKSVSPHLYHKIVEYAQGAHRSEALPFPPGLDLRPPADHILSASPETQKRLLLRGTSNPILTESRGRARLSAHAASSSSIFY
jgi:hypothetical protein